MDFSSQPEYLLSIKRGTGLERNSRVKCAWAWAMQGWVTCWEVGHQYGELQGEGCSGFSSPGMGDLLGGKK